MNLVDLYRPFRRNSYLIVSALILLGTVLGLGGKRLHTGHLILLAGLVAGLWGLQRILRPGKQGITSAEQVLRLIGRGRPTFVNFYSNL